MIPMLPPLGDPEWGNIFLMLALLWSLVQILAALAFQYQHQAFWLTLSERSAQCANLSTVLAFITLIYAFACFDWSVLYVASHAHSHLPWYYRLTAVWGGHEGSILLWLCLWSLLLTVFLFRRTTEDPLERSYFLVLAALIALGFQAFIFFTSNPFLRSLPAVPQEGTDLNPLLQDWGFIVHPPMLYLGYVGFSLCFVSAMAALWRGQVHALWAQNIKPWVYASFAALTLGITLGSWWAYRELGWGGFWFWDPVENASLLPWFLGLSWVHALSSLAKGRSFAAWNIVLAIGVFALSLLATFLVRSGVLVSVHAFASDPQRGVFILGFFVAILALSMMLFFWKGAYLEKTSWNSPRALALAAHHGLMMLMMLTVLMGTLYPIAMEVFGWGSLSVGAPYFNEVMPTLVYPAIVAMAVAPFFPWDDFQPRVFTRMMFRVLSSACLSAVLVWYFLLPFWPQERAFYWGYAALCLLGGSLIESMRRSYQRGRFSMKFLVGHFGGWVTLLGILFASFLSSETLCTLKLGEDTHFKDLKIHYLKTQAIEGSNYRSTQAIFEVRSGFFHYRLMPERREYFASHRILSDADIHIDVGRDVYFNVGDIQPNGEAALKIYIKPGVRWMWLGGLLMACSVLWPKDKKKQKPS